MRPIHSTLAALTIIVAASPALAHLDITLQITEGKVHANGTLFADHDDTVLTKPSSVWRTTDPGFAGTGLGSNRVFDLVSVGPLWSHNGSQFVAAGDEFLRVFPFGDIDNSIDITGTSSLQTLLTGAGVANSSGSLHSHPTYQLLTTAAGDPADGAYLVEFRVASESLATSDSFWVLFHKGLSVDDFNAAIQDAVVFIPEPGALAMLVTAGGALLLRRRREARMN